MRTRLSTLSSMLGLSVFVTAVSVAGAFAANPFSVSASVEAVDGRPAVRVRFGIPARHFLYADYLEVKGGEGVTVEPLSVPEAATVYDQFSEEDKRVYDKDFDAVYGVRGASGRFQLVVDYQGCDDKVCFFPQSETFDLALEESAGGGVVVSDAADGGEGVAVAADWRAEASRFRIASTETGYIKKDDFLAFLDRGMQAGEEEDLLASQFRRFGVVFTVLLILVGGVGLNLTPCVLPLIPINLAIIGAGAQAGSRRRGFALGAAYGLGMAAVYGALGLAVVLTGSRFGTLNASPWFNLAIALIFGVLALAMFDIITIDFTRFQRTAATNRRGHFLAALTMGSIAALLAGACVAPVVISVLLLAGGLYSKGHTVALLLPFVLGLGMGLPWPFAGAGLSFLPKPGKWMTWVKYIFGVLILLFALYYGRLAVNLFRSSSEAAGASHGSDAAAASGESPGEDAKLAAQLRSAARAGRPVFIDFWATWCKNCLAMEKGTFRDPDVIKRLGEFEVIKYQAEQPGDEATKAVLDYFGAIGGLPTYVVLVPNP